MTKTTKQPVEASQVGVEAVPTRVRRGMRRASFRVPKPAVAVRGLWEAAPEEQRARAHASAVAVMEYWLGRATKQEAAEKLKIPPLRVWQLSQQALSGMVAGLLKQPKSRKGVVSLDPMDDPKALRKRIGELERLVATQDRLIAILREMPGCREVRLPEAEPPKEGKRGRKPRKTVLPGGPNEGGGMAPAGSVGPKG